MSRDATLLESLSQFTVHPTWFIKTPTNPTVKENKLQRFFSHHCHQQVIYEARKNRLTIDYIKDNLSSIIVFILYILVNLALAIYVIIYRITVTRSHAFVVVARIGGMLLNFNCALVITLMLKQTILVIRTNSFLRKIIPVDDHIDFHKVVGRFIAVLSIVHTIAHMANFGRLTGTNTLSQEERSSNFSIFRSFLGNVHGTFTCHSLPNEHLGFFSLRQNLI